jgi:UDP-3-O-[3-hydroxymyristoyl] glucosamine N-acyltransferase
VVVGSDCSIREAVLARGVRAGDGVRVEPGAVVGERAQIGEGVVVAADARVQPGEVVK